MLRAGYPVRDRSATSLSILQEVVQCALAIASKGSARAPAAHAGNLPWIRLRSASPGLSVFRGMVDDVDPKAQAGDQVAVYDKADAPYGVALYNPCSVITLRLLTRDVASFDADTFFADRLRQALALRRDTLGLERTTDAYRLVYDQGDGLPGLVIDRYGDLPRASGEFLTDDLAQALRACVLDRCRQALETAAAATPAATIGALTGLSQLAAYVGPAMIRPVVERALTRAADPKVQEVARWALAMLDEAEPESR